MVKATVAEILEKAKTLDPETYLAWCDTIEALNNAKPGPFDVPLAVHDKQRVVQISGFYWPDAPARVDDGGRRVLAFKEPGAYIETYSIFAINRTAKLAWGMISVMAGTPDPVLSAKTATAVCEAFNQTWHSVRQVRIARENAAVDNILAKARELSPEAYLDWCDEHEDEFMAIESYNDHYAGHIIVRDQNITGIRYTTQRGDTCDIFAVCRKSQLVYGVRYYENDPDPLRDWNKIEVPETPLLSGATADAVLAAAVVVSKGA